MGPGEDICACLSLQRGLLVAALLLESRTAENREMAAEQGASYIFYAPPISNHDGLPV